MIINKTPHPVMILDGNNATIMTIPACPSDALIRLKAETVQDEPIEGVHTTRTVFGEPTGLPEFSKNVFYVVSQIVKSALPERTDLLVPAEVVRDKAGTIIGCRSLGR